MSTTQRPMIGRTGACQYTCCARHDNGTRKQVKAAEREAARAEIRAELLEYIEAEGDWDPGYGGSVIAYSSDGWAALVTYWSAPPLVPVPAQQGDPWDDDMLP